ncbi:MAG: aldo/keto reductase [Propionibacteriaceae bacterium]|nr:aldo/keto reductase [Propionibacteriaceae bacterium]
MGVLSEHFTLSNGVSIPKLGFGTWQTPNEVASEVVQGALRSGYTHIDTARAYQNEEGVGQGVRASGLLREDLFITTKVKAEFKSYEQAKTSIETSLAQLDLGYIDLLLIHAPKPWPEMFKGIDTTYFEENLAVWTAMEEAYQRGDVRAIGVSNFSIADIENITVHAATAPMANQIRLHVGHTQADLVAYCQQHAILVEAYSPIATGKLLDDPQVAAVATRNGVSVAQLCIRYALQKGCLPLPKAVHPEYIVSNTQIDFELSADDMAELDAIG